MANPEDFFWEGLLIEPVPPSPPVFTDLPMIALASGNGGDPSFMDNQVLPHISRMLMEDDIDDKFSNEYSDHPGLLQVQQPFTQILSTPSFGGNNDSTETTGSAASSLLCIDRSNTGEAKDLLPVDSGDQSAANLAFFRGADMEAVRAFLNGMEEASMFLPRENNFIRKEVSGNGRGRKNSYDRDRQLEEEVGRTRKVAAVITEPREIAAREMFDELLLCHDACIKNMEKMRIDMCNEMEKQNRKSSHKAVKKVVDLRMLLIHCAQAVATDNHLGVGELLKQIKQHASPIGDATQRLAHCFAKGLEARLGGIGSQLHQMHLRVPKGIPSMDFLKVYKLSMAACCFYKVAVMFSTMNIMHAVAGKDKLHIVDYGMNCGLRWSGLLRRLSSREGGPPEVKITAINLPQPGFRPTEKIEEVGRVLSICAHEFGLKLKFQAIATKWEAVRAEDLNVDPEEVLVVNELFTFGILMNESVFFDSPNPRDVVLCNIRKMRPDVFIQGIVNCSHGTTFLSRFRALLFFCSAMFDMLDATIPRESEVRSMLEQDILGQYAQNVIACEGANLLAFPEQYRQWQVRNQRAGLRQLPLTPGIVKALRDEASKDHHKDFFLGEDGQWLLQGWMGRILFAHSTWVPQEASSK